MAAANTLRVTERFTPGGPDPAALRASGWRTRACSAQRLGRRVRVPADRGAGLRVRLPRGQLRPWPTSSPAPERRSARASRPHLTNVDPARRPGQGGEERQRGSEFRPRSNRPQVRRPASTYVDFRTRVSRRRSPRRAVPRVAYLIRTSPTPPRSATSTLMPQRLLEVAFPGAACVSVLGGLARPRGLLRRGRDVSRASASVSRTESPCHHLLGQPPRPWRWRVGPGRDRRSGGLAIRCSCTLSGRAVRRRGLATWLRGLPTRLGHLLLGASGGRPSARSRRAPLRSG